MSEPKAVAKTAREIVSGLFHYRIPDERIRTESDACVVVEGARRLLGVRVGVLCFGHGEPMTEGARQAVADLLARDAGRKGT